MHTIQSILVGVDFSAPSAAALEEAGRLASWQDAHLSVLHVLHDEVLAAARHYTGLEADEILAGRRLRLDRFCLETLGTRAVPSLSLDVTVGHPFSVIMNRIEEEKTDLIVLGAHGESHPQTSKVGTLASHFVRMAPCKTLLVRAGQTSGFRRVVVAVDLSANSRQAIRTAADIVKADGGELHILHIYAPAWKTSAVESGEVHISDAEVENYLDQIETRVTEFVTEELPDFAGLAATIAVRESFSRGGGIVNYLNEVGADLVVIGSRAHQQADLGNVGATAEYMIQDAPCSVLTIQPEAEAYHAADEAGIGMTQC